MAFIPMELVLMCLQTLLCHSSIHQEHLLRLLRLCSTLLKLIISSPSPPLPDLPDPLFTYVCTLHVVYFGLVLLLSLVRILLSYHRLLAKLARRVDHFMSLNSQTN